LFLSRARRPFSLEKIAGLSKHAKYAGVRRQVRHDPDTRVAGESRRLGVRNCGDVRSQAFAITLIDFFHKFDATTNGVPERAKPDTSLRQSRAARITSLIFR
jgi:hypothetical protein